MSSDLSSSPHPVVETPQETRETISPDSNKEESEADHRQIVDIVQGHEHFTEPRHSKNYGKIRSRLPPLGDAFWHNRSFGSVRKNRWNGYPEGFGETCYFPRGKATREMSEQPAKLSPSIANASVKDVGTDELKAPPVLDLRAEANEASRHRTGDEQNPSYISTKDYRPLLIDGLPDSHTVTPDLLVRLNATEGRKAIDLAERYRIEGEEARRRIPESGKGMIKNGPPDAARPTRLNDLGDMLETGERRRKSWFFSSGVPVDSPAPLVTETGGPIGPSARFQGRSKHYPPEAVNDDEPDAGKPRIIGENVQKASTPSKFGNDSSVIYPAVVPQGSLKGFPVGPTARFLTAKDRGDNLRAGKLPIRPDHQHNIPTISHDEFGLPLYKAHPLQDSPYPPIGAFSSELIGDTHSAVERLRSDFNRKLSRFEDSIEVLARAKFDEWKYQQDFEPRIRKLEWMLRDSESRCETGRYFEARGKRELEESQAENKDLKEENKRLKKRIEELENLVVRDDE